MPKLLMGFTHEASVFAALYISEGWYDCWCRTKSLHAKARALVIYDRALNYPKIPTVADTD